MGFTLLNAFVLMHQSNKLGSHEDFDAIYVSDLFCTMALSLSSNALYVNDVFISLWLWTLS